MGRSDLKALIDSGVARAVRVRDEVRAGGGGLDAVAGDPRFLTTLDRLTDLGDLLVEHDAAEPWSHLLDGLLRIFRVPEFEELVYHARIDAEYGSHFAAFAHRLLTLGALTVRRGRYALAAELVRRQPRKKAGSDYWFTSCVKLTARSGVKDVQLLIPRAVDYVRGQPRLLASLGGNLDGVTDYMCQFDLFQCALVLAEEEGRNYFPGFAAFDEERALPMARLLVGDAAVRQVLGLSKDDDVAEVLRQLRDHALRQTGPWFAERWRDPVVQDFLARQEAAPPRVLVGAAR